MATKIQRQPDYLSGQGETLLIIDPDYLMRELLSDILTLNGYNVTLAINPEHAKMIYRSRQENIDLILCDIEFEGLGSLISDVTAQHSTPMLIFTKDKLAKKNPPSFIGFTILQKPFDVLELFKSIRVSLDENVTVASNQSSGHYLM